MDVSLTIRAGEFFGLIGETGAGKSMTAWATVGLIQPPGRITRGRVFFEGRDLLTADERSLRSIRGREIAMVVQNARAALNPMLSIGMQIANAYRAHHDVEKREAKDRAIEALRSVGLPDPLKRVEAYPHQLSGGMAQRVLIALAMVNRPRLLIADEPTTGLDVTIQAEILDLMSELVAAQGSSVWIITHDLGVIANHTERAAVMFAGQVVETGSTEDLFTNPRHPYTQELVEAARHERPLGEREATPPDLFHRPTGCQFRYRCPLAESDCASIMPMLDPIMPGHDVRCLVVQRAVSNTGAGETSA
jgi:peptide/nickel transport system ATP-binding protein/oligopeptide transport system ATP-binding protein